MQARCSHQHCTFLKTAELHLTSQATALQVPSEQRYCPVSHGWIMLMVRVTLAFRLGME